MTKKGLKIITVTFFLAIAIYGAFMALGIPFVYSAALSDYVASTATETTKPPVKPASPVNEVPVKGGETPLPIPVPKVETAATATVKETAMSLKVFDKTIDLSGIPIIVTKEGKTVLPLRKLGEALGYSVNWDDSIKAAILQKGTETITVKINSVEYTWGSVPRKLSSKPETYKSRLYVPTDFVTSNPTLSLSQTPTAIVIGLAEKEAKNAVTGAIEEVTQYSNGLGLMVSEKSTSLMLYVSDDTVITNYSTGAVLDKTSLKTGTKAIFSYTTVQGDEQKNYFLLKSIEVVDEVESKKLQ